MEMYDVFISYRRSDGQAVADELYQYLTAKGLRVFLDKEKLEKGDTFPEQLRENLLKAPNYVLIATNDVFQFRDGIDWVREEIEIAVKEYREHRMDRTITTLVLEDTIFPDTMDLPECVRGIEDVERIALPICASEKFVFSEKVEETFMEVFETVTKITSGNLWNAAHRWLEESKKEQGRFSKLNICESILPNVEIKNETAEIPILVSQGEQAEESKPLFQAIAESEGHVFLVGQGGIGKTTAFMHIMNREYVSGSYVKGDQIPIFVELSFAPDTYGELYRTEISSFIRRSVYRQIRTDLKVKQVSYSVIDELDEIFTIAPEVAVRPVTDIFSRQTPAPEYLLLLDGLNEVSTVRLPECNKTILQMVTEEIQYLMKECSNVRVILTSRSDEVDIGSANVTKLYLDGIEDEAIRQYLSDAKISKEKIECICKDSNLMETLRIPLFLTMYVTLSEDNDAVTQGEILRLFFSERRKNIELYTNQNRWEILEENLRNAANEVQLNRITAEMYHFMLDFVLPEIAWYMERKGKFYLSLRDIRKEIIEPLLMNEEDTDIGGEFGIEVFDKYSKGRFCKNVGTTIAEIKTIMGGPNDYDFKKIAETIVACCIVNLGILQKSNKRFGFVHQHIRDYFAAIKNINTIRMAVYMQEEEENETALACMNRTFYEEPVKAVVRRFMGEYLGEHKNKPYYDSNDRLCYGVPKEECDRNLIDRVLDVYRGYFDGECGYGIYSLLKILYEMRGMLAGGDYSDLDLTSCTLNGVRLSEEGLVSNLANAKIYGENLFFAGHRDFVRKAYIISDGKELITVGRDSIVCIWDIKTGAVRRHMQIEKRSRHSPQFEFIQNGTKLMVQKAYRGKSSILIWDVKMEHIERELELDVMFTWKRVIHPNGTSILFCETDKVCMWNMENTQVDCIYEETDAFCIESCSYMDKERILVIYSYDNKMFPYDENYDEYFYEDAVFDDEYEFGCVEHKFTFLDVETQEVVRRDTFIAKSNIKEMACFEKNICVIWQEEESQRYILRYRTYENTDWKDIYEVNRKYLQHLAFSNSGCWLAVLEQGILKIFDGKTFCLKKSLQLEQQIMDVTFYDEHNKCVVFTREGDIFVYDTDYFEPILSIRGSMTEFEDVCALDKEHHFMTLGSDASLSIWNTEKGKLVWKKKVNDIDAALNIGFHKIKKQVCITGGNKTYVYQLPSFKQLFEEDGTGRFSRDGKYLYLNKREEETVLLDTEMYLPVFQMSNIGKLLVQINELIIFEDSYYEEEKGKVFVYKIVHMNQRWIKEFRLSKVGVYQIAALKNKIEFLFEGGTYGVFDTLSGNWVSDEFGISLKKESIVWKREYDFLVAITKDNIKIEWEYLKGREKRNKYKLKISDFDAGDLQNTPVFELECEELGQAKVNENEDEIMVIERNDKISIYSINRIHGEIVVNKKGEILGETGLDVLGLDLRKLHPDSVFTEEEYEKLRMYGAIIA